MERPKIKIPLDSYDYVIELITAIFMILLIAWPFFFFQELPDVIPRHFNAAGEPDGYSQKNIIWALPAIGLILYAGMLLLNRYPYVYNYPTEITAENADKHYRIATKLIRTLNLLIATSFFYLAFATIETAMNKQDGLSDAFLTTFLLLIFATITSYLYLALRKSR